MSNNKQNSSIIHLPGLNGLRAIAALAVVVSHITLSLNEFGLNPYIIGKTAEGNPQSLNLAAYGVSIFFALSGFLITFLLLKETEIKPVNIKNFYIRRALRIWPLYYTYFILCIITLSIFGISYNNGAVGFYIFLAANIPFILDTAIPFLAHYWSLGVEEQFYAFWPWVVKKIEHKLLKTIVVITVILMALRLITRLIEIKYSISLPSTIITVTRFQCMLIGAIGAILFYQKNKMFLSFATHKATQFVSWGVIVLLAINKFYVPSFINNEVVSFVTVLLITAQVTKQNRLINLENAFCDFIGKISYGIYVIHPLIIFYLSKIIGKLSANSFWNYLLIYTTVLIVTIIVSYISYEYFEKKFLKLKERFTAVKSSATKNFSLAQV